MNNEWSFKIELRNPEIFKEIEDKYDVEFPDSLKEFIVLNNAASPNLNCVNINGIERVYAETLSFNEDEEEALTFSYVMDTIKNFKYIPFAVDPFGNYFCYALDKDTISYYEHEENVFSDTELSLGEFIDSLY